jgi:MraZ protein
MDSSSRILVPIELREFSGIKKSAMFIGQGQRFEIWNYRSWTESRDSWLKMNDFSLTEKLKDISI